MKKNIITLLLICIITLLGVTGCGSDEKKDSNKNVNESTTTKTSESISTLPTQEEIKNMPTTTTKETSTKKGTTVTTKKATTTKTEETSITTTTVKTTSFYDIWDGAIKYSTEGDEGVEYEEGNPESFYLLENYRGRILDSACNSSISGKEFTFVVENKNNKPVTLTLKYDSGKKDVFTVTRSAYDDEYNFYLIMDITLDRKKSDNVLGSCYKNNKFYMSSMQN